MKKHFHYVETKLKLAEIETWISISETMFVRVPTKFVHYLCLVLSRQYTSDIAYNPATL